MAVTENVAEMDLYNYSIVWNSVTLGYVKELDPSGIKLKTKDLKIGKFGDIIVGKRIIGIEGTIKAVLHQVSKNVIQAMCPWWASGSVALSPALRHKDIYDYAQALIIHPIGVTGTDEDISMLKAFPMFGLAKGDGENWREIPVEFQPFPDRSALSTNNYPTFGYYGAPV